jgi:hypothetical protein
MLVRALWIAPAFFFWHVIGLFRVHANGWWKDYRPVLGQLYMATGLRLQVFISVSRDIPIYELTTRAFGTAFVMGCAHYSLRTSGPWPPARRGLRPQTPAVVLYSIFNPTA